MGCGTGIPDWICDLRGLTDYVDELTNLASHADALTDLASNASDLTDLASHASSLRSLAGSASELTGLASAADSLMDLSSYASELSDFASSPATYIMEVILTTFVGWFLSGIGYLIEQIQLFFSPLLSLPSAVASPLMLGGGLLVSAISGLITTINDTVVSLSMLAGPAAPIVVLVFWGLIAIVAVDAARMLIRLLPEVIPWL